MEYRGLWSGTEGIMDRNSNNLAGKQTTGGLEDE